MSKIIWNLIFIINWNDFMEEMMLTDNEIKHPDCPFAELFHLLTSSEDYKIKYTSNQLRAMYFHSEKLLMQFCEGCKSWEELLGLLIAKKV